MTLLALTQNMTDAGIREEVNELFDQFILDAFDAVDPIMDIGQEFAYIGIGIIALKVFLISCPHQSRYGMRRLKIIWLLLVCHL